MRLLTAALVCGLILVGCTSDPEPVSEPTPTQTPSTPEQASDELTPAATGDVVTGLQAPWSVAFDGNGIPVVSERNSGRISRVPLDGGATQEITRIAEVDAEGEGGLMGLAFSPSSDALYAMFTAANDNRVVRMAWNGTSLGQPEVVFDGIPKAGIHNGGRIAFGPDGQLYVATGDAGEGDRAQDPSDLAGKILRLNPDGSVPTDNPTPGSPVFSTGHRNVQGLAFDEEGRLWASEFGAKDTDELNLIEAGGNYGWPIVEGASDNPEFINPIASWTPTSVASPSGIAIADGSIWVATLRGQTLYRVPTSSTPTESTAFLAGDFGRLRDVVRAPDGSLWVLTNNTDGRGDPRAGDDRILQLTLN